MPNGRSSTDPQFTLPLRLNNISAAEISEQFQAAKRKFQRVNQEIVKQNVALHDQLAKNRQEHHLVLQENIRLKGKIVALESKISELEGILVETKVVMRTRENLLNLCVESNLRTNGYAGSSRTTHD